MLCYFLTVWLCLLFVRLFVRSKHFCLLENNGSSRPLGSREMRSSNSLTEDVQHSRNQTPARSFVVGVPFCSLTMYPLQIGVLGFCDLKNWTSSMKTTKFRLSPFCCFGGLVLFCLFLFWFHLGFVLIDWLVFEKAICIYLEVFIYTSLPLTAPVWKQESQITFWWRYLSS